MAGKRPPLQKKKAVYSPGRDFPNTCRADQSTHGCVIIHSTAESFSMCGGIIHIIC